MEYSNYSDYNYKMCDFNKSDNNKLTKTVLMKQYYYSIYNKSISIRILPLIAKIFTAPSIGCLNKNKPESALLALSSILHFTKLAT